MVTTRANWLLRLKEATSSPSASMVGAPRTLSAIDSILEGKILKAPEPVGPLLMKIGKSARFLDVSRMTFRRMRKKRELQKVEILPGSSWLRRSDLEAITEKTPIFNRLTTALDFQKMGIVV